MKTEFPGWIANDKAWLFDLDGTLVDSAACIAAAWRTWCQRHNLNVEEVIQKAHGRRSCDTVKLLIPDSDLDQEVVFLEDLECELVEGLGALPGAHRLLEHVGNSPWAIVTSGSNRIATHRIQYAHLPKPTVLISADDVANGKPDPEGYLLADDLISPP